MTKTKTGTKNPITEEKSGQRYTFEKKPDNTISIKIVVPWNEVDDVKKEVVGELVKEVELPGFRKGMAPKNLSEAKLSKEKVNEEILKKILTKEYVEAVKQNNIKPVINPKIHIEAFDDGTDLEFIAITCEEPIIKLNNYKEEVKKITSKAKIIIPGKEEKPAPLEEILEAVLKNTEITIPEILSEQEANRLLSQLLDELKTLGVSLDQFLSTRGKNADQLRAEYVEKAQKDLKLEFILRKIADEEKITVEQKDVEETVNSLKDEAQKQEVMKNPYFLAAIIRQQKTIDFLSKI